MAKLRSVRVARYPLPPIAISTKYGDTTFGRGSAETPGTSMVTVGKKFPSEILMLIGYEFQGS